MFDLKDKVVLVTGGGGLLGRMHSEVVVENGGKVIVGDINIEKPGFLNLKSKSKWNAWNEIKGMSQEDAKVNYVNLAMEYGEKYN